MLTLFQARQSQYDPQHHEYFCTFHKSRSRLTKIGLFFSQFQPQASPATLQNNTQVKHHPDVTLNALNTEVDVEGSLDFDSTAPDV